MNESKFWMYINQSCESGNSNEFLKEMLYGKSPEEIVSFKNILLQKLVDSYVFPLLTANFVISSYVSDDGFKEFRAWLISKGKSKFLKAIDDPETIADWLEKNEVDEIDGEDFLYLADEIYAELVGDEKAFYQKLSFTPDPDISMEWPESKAAYERRFPRLVAKYWNQQRIEEMHPN